MSNRFFNNNCSIDDSKSDISNITYNLPLEIIDQNKSIIKEQERIYKNEFKQIGDIQVKLESKISEFPTKETITKEINNTESEKQLENTKDINIDNSLLDFSQDLINNDNVKIKKLKKDLTSTGKKRGRPGKKGDHNKYSDDNLRRKVKHLTLKKLLQFINKKIEEKYKTNIGNGVFIKRLLTINQKQKSDATIQFNKDLLKKPIGEIFSENISTRYTNYPLSHNKSLIQLLLKDEDINKRIYFNKLFNLSFLDCLKHIRGSEEIEELIGLEGLDSIKKEYEDDKDYVYLLDRYFKEFESNLYNKRIRKPKKKDIKNEKDN